MRRALASLCVLSVAVAACQRTWGALLVRVDLAGDAVTACVGVTVGTGRPEVAVPRAGLDLLKIAVSQDQELTGTVPVTVQRYRGAGCTLPEGLPLTQQGTLELGQLSELTFRFSTSPADGGPDGGPDGGGDGGLDGGLDGGCTCDAPACQLGPGRCLPGGGCEGQGPSPASTGCDGGLCDGLGSCRAPCQVLPDLSACDDGLSCTGGDRCLGGACQGTCLNAPQCQTVAQQCLGASTCVTTPQADGTGCSLDGGTGQCLLGACVRALPFPPSNLAGPLLGYPSPRGDWLVAAGCEAVIDTGLAVPGPPDGGWCAPLGPAADVRQLPSGGGEVAVLSAGTFQLGAGATLHFVGSRPVVLVVLGDATVLGTLSAGATTLLVPAGAGGAACAAHNPALDAADAGGGGGAGFGTSGGNGGNDPPGAGLGGGPSASTLLVPLRGGCQGGGPLGGAGGGALQLTAGGQLMVGDAGVVTASGGGGAGGALRRGGGGGGSGGAVLLEASQLVQLGFVTANGGGGGEGGSAGKPGEAGAPGALATVTPAPGGGSGAGGPGGTGGAGTMPAGAAGGIGAPGEGGGGGGGAVGRYLLRSVSPCQATPARLSGVAAAGGNCP